MPKPNGVLIRIVGSGPRGRGPRCTWQPGKNNEQHLVPPNPGEACTLHIVWTTERRFIIDTNDYKDNREPCGSFSSVTRIEKGDCEVLMPDGEKLPNEGLCEFIR